MPDYTWITVIVIVGGIFFWLTADKVYQSHLNTKEHHPTLFKLTGFNVRYIGDREKWVKHFRIQLVLVVVLFVAVMWMNAVLW